MPKVCPNSAIADLQLRNFQAQVRNLMVQLRNCEVRFNVCMSDSQCQNCESKRLGDCIPAHDDTLKCLKEVREKRRERREERQETEERKEREDAYERAVISALEVWNCLIKYRLGKKHRVCQVILTLVESSLFGFLEMLLESFENAFGVLRDTFGSFEPVSDNHIQQEMKRELTYK